MAGYPSILTEVHFDSFEENIHEVLEIARPDWSMKSVKFKLFTEGITNKLIGCYLDSNKVDMVLVRLFGKNTELIIDRDVESSMMTLLSSYKMAPAVYCRFANGVCYGYIPGYPLDEKMVCKDNIFRLIAKEMAYLHSIPPPAAAESNKKFAGVGNMDTKPFLFPKLRSFLNRIPDNFNDPKQQERYTREVLSEFNLEAEYEELHTLLQDTDCPIVLCHNDLLLKNIIYNETEDKIHFIDFEYTGFNYQPYDIGNHFCEYAGVDEVDYSRYPDEAYQMKWLRVYLEFYQKASGKSTSFTDEDVRKLYVLVNKFAVMAHFLWGVWALIQAKHSTIDFDFLGYAILRLNEFHAKKDQFLSLKVSA